jgi:hypothetical protein
VGRLVLFGRWMVEAKRQHRKLSTGNIGCGARVQAILPVIVCVLILIGLFKLWKSLQLILVAIGSMRLCTRAPWRRSRIE